MEVLGFEPMAGTTFKDMQAHSPETPSLPGNLDSVSDAQGWGLGSAFLHGEPVTWTAGGGEWGSHSHWAKCPQCRVPWVPWGHRLTFP